MDMLARVRKRIPEDTISDDDLQEYIDTMSDRLCLRLGMDILPRVFESICVDAAVKMYRRTYYEGIATEGAANMTTSFVDDILDEYMNEITTWKDRQANGEAGSGKVVYFR